VKTNITCTYEGVDCSAYNWTELCHNYGDYYGGFTVKYFLENNGSTPMTIQAVDIMEPRFTPPNKTDYLPFLAKNPMGPGQTNVIQLERRVAPCSHVNANFTLVVQSVPPGGMPCSSTIMYAVQDLRCINIISEFCGNLPAAVVP
jgi:hypothetical protein